MSVINLSKKSPFSNLVYWLLALSIFALGMYLSVINWLGFEWFSRSGCVVVVFGVWSSIGVVLHEKLITRRASWIRNKEIRQLTAKNVNEADIALGIDQINNNHDQRLHVALQDLRLSVGVLEMSLLISGTVVWGFGDIVVLLLLAA